MALTVSLMRYLSDIRMGRVNPKHFKFGLDVRHKKYDLPQFLRQQIYGPNPQTFVFAFVLPKLFI